MKSFLLIFLLSLFLTTPAFSSEPTGNWCRSEGGNLLDVINITRHGETYKVNLREGWGKPIYSEGVGTFASNHLTATLKSGAAGTIIHAPMTISEDNLTYISYNLDTSFRWKGSYIRCKR